MDTMKARAVQHYGSLVALEGPPDAVSTQLRLLPHSPKILVLPPLDHYTKKEDDDSQFDARSYILRIHEACNARADAANSFLRDSTSGNRRLVFMPGGTGGAQKVCIAAISEHVTDGDFTRAETIFNSLVRNGVEGLRSQIKAKSKSVSRARGPDGRTNRKPGLYADAAAKAMAAAEALDRETESLQPDDMVDLTLCGLGLSLGHRRSISVPIRCVDGELEDSAPFYVFGTINSSTSKEALRVPHTPRPRSMTPTLSIVETLESAESERSFELNTSSFLGENMSRLSPAPPSHNKSFLRLSMASTSADFTSPRSDIFGSPTEPSDVVFGQASIVDVRLSRAWSTPEQSPRSLRRVRSLDRIFAGAVTSQDVSAGNLTQTSGTCPSETQSGSATPVRHAASRNALLSSPSSKTAQHTTARPVKTTVRRSPPKPLDLATSRSIRRHQYVEKGTSPSSEYTDKATWTGAFKTFYVDRGADADTDTDTDAGLDTSEGLTKFLDETESQADEEFEVVLPVYEDLVIQLKDENPDVLLESVLEGLRAGKYPVTVPLLVLHETESSSERSLTPESLTSMRSSLTSVSETKKPLLFLPEVRVDEDEYDPFASHDYSPKPPSEWIGRTSLTQIAGIPTLAQSRHQSMVPPGTKFDATGTHFHEFKTTGKTPVGVQDVVRSILNIYFTPEKLGFQQFKLLPDLGSLWRPVFRGADTQKLGNGGEKLDLILAVGAQKGVSKELLSSITGSLEKLGAKPNGVNRSGRLDLTYLIANAVQSHASQGSAGEFDDPMTQPLLLAALVIPHLETYLAAHCKTRYLILEYQPEHLTVIMVLQRLIGVNLFKVAGIINSDAPESGSARNSTSSVAEADQAIRNSIKRASVLANPAVLMSVSGLVPTEAPRFSKANFLLTSCATESEIATFISAIWKVLVDISHFYIPDGAPRAQLSERTSSKNSAVPNLVVPSQENASYNSAAAMMGFTASTSTPPVSPPRDRLTPGSATRITKVTTYPPKEQQVVVVKSSATSVKSSKSTRTTRTARSQRSRLHRYLAHEIGAEGDRLSVRTGGPGSIFTELSDDEDGSGRFWADERRYMPLFLREPETRKGNTRKALKFLGLAN